MIKLLTTLIQCIIFILNSSFLKKENSHWLNTYKHTQTLIAAPYLSTEQEQKIATILQKWGYIKKSRLGVISVDPFFEKYDTIAQQKVRFFVRGNKDSNSSSSTVTQWKHDILVPGSTIMIREHDTQEELEFSLGRELGHIHQAYYYGKECSKGP